MDDIQSKAVCNEPIFAAGDTTDVCDMSHDNDNVPAVACGICHDNDNISKDQALWIAVLEQAVYDCLSVVLGTYSWKHFSPVTKKDALSFFPTRIEDASFDFLYICECAGILPIGMINAMNAAKHGKPRQAVLAGRHMTKNIRCRPRLLYRVYLRDNPAADARG